MENLNFLSNFSRLFIYFLAFPVLLVLFTLTVRKGLKYTYLLRYLSMKEHNDSNRRSKKRKYHSLPKKSS